MRKWVACRMSPSSIRLTAAACSRWQFPGGVGSRKNSTRFPGRLRPIGGLSDLDKPEHDARHAVGPNLGNSEAPHIVHDDLVTLPSGFRRGESVPVD